MALSFSNQLHWDVAVAEQRDSDLLSGSDFCVRRVLSDEKEFKIRNFCSDYFYPHFDSKFMETLVWGMVVWISNGLGRNSVYGAFDDSVFGIQAFRKDKKAFLDITNLFNSSSNLWNNIF